MDSEKNGGPGTFPSTMPPQIRDAADPATAVYAPALNQLVMRYRSALLQHVKLRLLKWNSPLDRAEDVLHDFFEQKLVLERRVVTEWNSDKGKFRNFILTYLDRFTASWLRKQAAAKRSPEEGFAELDEVDRGPGIMSICESDLEWVRIVLFAAMKRVQEECGRTGDVACWGIFESRVVSPILEGTRPPSYEDLVSRFGLKSPYAVSDALKKARKRFELEVRAGIGEYCSSQEEVANELKAFREILGGAQG